MIRQICAFPGGGKTALMTMLALPHMKGQQAHRDLVQCKKLLARLNAGGFHYEAPSDHLLLADYTIMTGSGGRITNYECNGFNLGLFNDCHPTMFLPPASFINLDEAQKYFNSREKGLADSVSRFYELHRHYYLTITIAGQRPGLIDRNIRDLAEEVLWIEKLEHEQSGHRILSSQWTCVSFDSSAAAISYIDSGFSSKLRGDTVRFEYTGNIFKHYNSRVFFPAFLKGNEDAHFNLRHAVCTGYTRAEVEDFNDEHDYTVPDTYYKKRGKGA